MLTGELCHIAVYVRDNIVMVQQLCEDAIARLVKLQVGGEKTGQLIEDIKALFKDQVREHRQLGTVTPEYLESVKAEVAQLSQRLTQLVLGDIAAVAGMFEELYEYAKKNSALLSELIGRAERAWKDGTVRDNQAFTRLERVLVALISEFRPDVKAPAQAGAGERHGDLLRDRRREMLDHIFQTLREQRKDDGWRA